MNKLDELRNQIDEIDNQLLDLLSKRITIMEQIGDEKKALHMPIRDQVRENEKLAAMQDQAKELHIPESLVKQIWKLFFEVSEEIEK